MCNPRIYLNLSHNNAWKKMMHQRSPTLRYFYIGILCLVHPRAGEVQGGPEEAPQACDWHGRVSFHAAQPEHQQALQPSKMSPSCNPPVFIKLVALSRLSVRHPVAHGSTSEHSVSIITPPPHNTITDYWSARGFMHSAPSYKHPSVCDFIWWWSLPFSPSWPSHADLTSL